MSRRMSQRWNSTIVVPRPRCQYRLEQLGSDKFVLATQGETSSVTQVFTCKTPLCVLELLLRYNTCLTKTFSHGSGPRL